MKYSIHKIDKMWLFYALSSFLVSNIVMIPLKDTVKTEITFNGKFIEKEVKHFLANLIKITN